MQLTFIGKLGDSVHKLSASAVVFRTVIQIEKQGVDLGESPFILHPEHSQTIHDQITGDAG